MAHDPESSAQPPGEPLRPGDSAPSRPVPSARPGRSGCVVCGKPLTLHQEVSSSVCSPACLHRKGGLDARERRTAVMRQVEPRKAEFAARLGLQPGAPIVLAIVPSNSERRSILPSERRELFRTSLQQAIERAELMTGPVPGSNVPGQLGDTASPAYRSLLEQGCATCRGWCCNQGDTHAFLNEHEVRLQLDRTGLSGEELLRDYLAYATGETLESGCVMQGPTGCKLPREKRSRVCNEYHCEGLQLIGKDARAVLFAASDGRHVRRLAAATLSGRRVEADP